ncbi:cytosine permease [Litorimonas cladophorae]|uniref:Cytosine permease n=1 Tax=Litorimonas cladophorae TaxID=1220491 RepID=A0A918KTP3_9PROT|nr:cytosine permease [Litorimonas cladophorae]GGX73118.1 cytosine permease [Litorimonas cladophorae]
MEDNSEFAAVTITESQLVPWPRVAAVGAMVAFSLPTFVTGLEVGAGLSPMNTVWALLWGSIIIVIIGATMGVIGAKSRMSSYLLVRIAFGDVGAGLVNIAFAVSLLGWFGVNINLFMDAVAGLGRDVWGIELPPIGLAIFASFCMTLTTLIGFKAINLLASLLVPVLAVVTVLLAKFALSTQTLSEVFAAEKAEALTVGEGISAIVGAIIIGAIILPDITRFLKHWSGAIYTAIISYIIVQMAVMGAAALAGATSGKDDVLEIMLDLNLGIGAFIIVIAGSWVLNSLNLYSAVLGMKATFPKLKTVLLTIALGVIGVAAALMNILDNFIIFLFYLSVIFIPVAGVLMIDGLLIRPKAYRIETLENNRSLNWKGFVAWAVGAAIAILASEGITQPLSKIAAIDAVLLSAIIYIALAWNEREKKQVISV